MQINTSHNEYAPQISPEGSSLIFQSDRPGFLEGQNLWLSREQKTKASPKGKTSVDMNWEKSQPLSFPQSPQGDDFVSSNLSSFSVNTNGFEGSPALLYRSSLPIELYFTSLRENQSGRKGYSGLNIYFTRLERDRWISEKHLNVINSEFDDRMPALNQNGTFMAFSSNRPGGYGGYDLWFSIRNQKTGKWSIPWNAGASMNTSHNEITPWLSPKGKILFFSSDRPGGYGHYDFYSSKRYNRSGKGKFSKSKQKIKIQWNTPSNLGNPFNSKRDDEHLSITQDGAWAYFASDRRDPYAQGGFDIYRIKMPERLHFPSQVLFTGRILDSSSKEIFGVEATIRILSEDQTIVVTSSVIRSATEDSPTNNFDIYLRSGRVYQAEFSSPGFHPQKLILDYRGNYKAGRIDKHTILLEKVTREKILQKKDSSNPCLDELPACIEEITVYFPVDQDTISNSEIPKIKQVAQILKRHPDTEIYIEGHTDQTNTDTYNQSLSERRAEKIRLALIAEGIAKNRLQTKGYSFASPRIQDEKTPQDRAANRRVEFRLLTQE